MTSRLITLLLLVFLGLNLQAQRRNYVIQNSSGSYGIAISSGINTFNSKTISEKSSIGTYNSFGVTYLKHKDRISIETSFTYGWQSLKYNIETLQDSFKGNYLLKLNTISVPINIHYRFSQNRNRTYIFGGVQPSLIMSSKLFSIEESPRKNEEIAIYPKGRKNQNLFFSLQGGIGKAFDLDQNLMFRVEIDYRAAFLKIETDKYMANYLGIRLLFMNHL